MTTAQQVRQPPPSHQQVLAQARQGDAQAIERLINQVLQSRGIRVRAVRNTSCLHVLLEGAEVPDRLTYARVVYAAVLCLGAPPIQTVQVCGRQLGTKQPAWVQAFRLVEPPQNGWVEPASGPAAPVVIASPEPAAPKPGRWKLDLPLLVTIGAAGLGFGAGLTLLRSFQSSEALDAVSSPSPVPQASPTSPTTTATPTPASPSPVVVQPSPTAAPLTDIALTLKAVGDIIPGSNYPRKALPIEPGEALNQEREMLFGNIKPFFDEADILFGNFESTLTDHPYSAKDTSRGMTFAFRTPPIYAQMLKDLGFDVLSVANNHSFDFGDQGFLDTIANIEKTGMKAVGEKGEIVYTKANNLTVAFIGFSYLPDHNSMHDLEKGGALVREAKQNADIVVISVHAGAEGSDEVHQRNETEYFFGENRGNLVQFAHGLIDQGADLILGHGPHVPRALELYNGKLIAYSLGNFVGYQTLSTVGTLGDSLILKVQMNAKGDFVGGRIIPVALTSDGIPKLDDYFQSVVLIRNLIKQDFPQTPIAIDDMGYIRRTDR